MSSKLTLSIDGNVINRAKRIAKRRGKSLSKMVEEYFNSIPEKQDKGKSTMERIEERMEPYRDKLNIPRDIDYRKLVREWKYLDYLQQKGRV